MRIVVLVKQVPSTDTRLAFAPDLTVIRDAGPAGLNTADWYAVDQSLQIAGQQPDAEITAVTMGPAGAVDALRTALVLGARSAVHIRDDALHGSDALATSRVLAAAVDRLGFDLVLCGSATADSGMSAVPAMIAERLRVPALCFADRLEVRDRTVEIHRDDGCGDRRVLAATPPLVVSVTERCGEPPYPRFVTRHDARDKPIQVWTLATLGIDPAEVGLAGSACAVRSATPRRGRRPDCDVLAMGDPASVAVRVADFLAERQFL
ncbi:electron transfer flavoprotein subunit beta/FixA family protein [Paractinoplanes durhamensis]|uniref:Electron transfer flavoprotein subunit beta n=1 Tax=Paractinoplanes durhamensis TaxID=113563 RepID=A0ABQ3YRY1_9ACTN|nr:electron transfer flavoprotein subunit beta/FixA family protein [Actinoplanes durhamensis]GIE00264.1 electron transfer flavoprotein subunit beta [Actinoplanes durhamensis]